MSQITSAGERFERPIEPLLPIQPTQVSAPFVAATGRYSNEIFQRPGLYLRTPGGNVEDVAEMQSAGFYWLAWNEKDHPFRNGEWNVIAQRCRERGMAFFPWAYCSNQADMVDLGTAATLYGGSTAIFNLEREFHDGSITPDMVHDVIAHFNVNAALCVMPVPSWIPDYSPLVKYPLHIGIFPQENDEGNRPRDCRALWFNEGFERVTLMMGIHDLDPYRFPVRYGAYAIYTADDCGQDYDRWGTSQPIAPVSFPYKGPGYGPGPKQSKRSPAWKALKIAMHRAGYGDFSNPDYAYNAALVRAMQRFQRDHFINPTGNYGLASYQVLKTLPACYPIMGIPVQPAMNAEAVALMEAA